MKERLDVLMVKQGLVRSRTLASMLIRDGLVLVDGVVTKKPGTLSPLSATIKVTEKPLYVGRGGLKLAHALEFFKVSVAGLTIADIGASTGGFTDCLLQNGAKKVYAIDVGYNQLVPELRVDPRVVSMESTDIRTAKLSELVDIVVADVSFISITNILPSIILFLKKGGDAIVLVKPQFEVGKGRLGKGGVVKDELLQKEALETVVKKAESLGLSFVGAADSPILGGSGNKEYLAHFKKIYTNAIL